MALIDNSSLDDLHPTNIQKKIENDIHNFINNVDIRCAIHIQIQTHIYRRYKGKIDENLLFETVNDALLKLCEKNQLDAILLNPYVKKWKMVACDTKKISRKQSPVDSIISDHTTPTTVIQQGCYYSWSYEAIFDQLCLPRTHQMYVFDTYSLKKQVPHLLKPTLLTLSDFICKNARFREKLLWIKPAARKEFQ